MAEGRTGRRGVAMKGRACIASLLRACAPAALSAALLTVGSALPALAAGATGAPLRIGIVAEPGAGNTVAGLGLLKDAYARALGMPVEFLVARDYGALVEAQAAGRVQYAVYSALAYAAASQRCGCVEPVAAPVGMDGAIGIRSVLIVRRGGGADAPGVPAGRIVAGPPGSAVGALLPPAGPDGLDITHAESAAAAEAMFAQGQADALLGWQPAGPDGEPDPPGGTLARLEAAGMAAADLRVAWRSDLLRFGPHAVLKNLDAETKRRLGVFLTNLKAQSPEIYDLVERYHGGGFVSVGPQDYSAALAALRGAAPDTEEATAR